MAIDPLQLPVARDVKMLTRRNPEVWSDTLVGLVHQFLAGNTIKGLARKAGIQLVTLNQILRGRSHISLDVGIKLADALEISPRQVLSFVKRAWAARTAAEGREKPYRTSKKAEEQKS